MREPNDAERELSNRLKEIRDDLESSENLRVPKAIDSLIEMKHSAGIVGIASHGPLRIEGLMALLQVNPEEGLDPLHRSVLMSGAVVSTELLHTLLNYGEGGWKTFVSIVRELAYLRTWVEVVDRLIPEVFADIAVHCPEAQAAVTRGRASLPSFSENLKAFLDLPWDRAKQATLEGVVRLLNEPFEDAG